MIISCLVSISFFLSSFPFALFSLLVSFHSKQTWFHVFDSIKVHYTNVTRWTWNTNISNLYNVWTVEASGSRQKAHQIFIRSTLFSFSFFFFSHRQFVEQTTATCFFYPFYFAYCSLKWYFPCVGLFCVCVACSLSIIHFKFHARIHRMVFPMK